MIEEAEEWLSKFISPEIPLSERISFSGFYSKKKKFNKAQAHQ